MKKFLIKLAIFLVLVLIVWIVFFKLPYFDVTEIKISGIDNVSEQQVRELLTTSEGENIFSFSTFKSKKQLKTNHFIKNVSVKRILPNTVVVDIEEYNLRGYVPYMGSYLFINEEGLILSIQKEITKQLPIVEGLRFDGFTEGELLYVENQGAFQTMVELQRLFEKYELLSEIVKVDVSNTNDIHLYVNKVDVEIGDMDDINRKIIMLIEVLKQLDTNYAGRLNLSGDNATFEYLT